MLTFIAHAAVNLGYGAALAVLVHWARQVSRARAARREQQR